MSPSGSGLHGERFPLFQLDAKMLQSFGENLEEVFDVLHVDGTECAEAEGVRRRDLARVNRETTVVAVVVHLFEIPVRVFGVLDGNDEARFDGRVDNGIETKLGDTLADRLVHAAVTGKLCGFPFGEVFLERLDGGVDGLYRRGKVHFASLLEKGVLQVKVAVVRTRRVFLRLFDDVLAANHEGETGHSHKALLGGSHAEIHVVLHHVERNHAQGRSRVGDKDCVILVGKCANFTNRVQDARARFVVAAIDNGHIGIFLKGLFDSREVRAFKHARLHVDIRQVIHLADFDGAGVVSSVVHHENLLAFGNQRIDAHVDVDGARAAEKNGSVLIDRSMHHLEQVFTETLHEAGKGLFTGADIRNHLGVLDGIGGGGRAGVQQNVSLDRFHKFILKILENILFGVGEVVHVINFIPLEAIDLEHEHLHLFLRHGQQFVLVAQLRLVSHLGGVIFAHGLVELVGKLVYAHQFALRVQLRLVGGTHREATAFAIFHIVLVLELGHRRNEHDGRFFTFEERSNRLLLKNEIGFQKQEIVIADDITAVVQRVHAVGFGVARTEHAFNLRVGRFQRLVLFLVVAGADDDAFNTTGNERLDAAFDHGKVTAFDKALGNGLGILAEAGSHSRRHDDRSLDHATSSKIP